MGHFLENFHMETLPWILPWEEAEHGDFFLTSHFNVIKCKWLTMRYMDEPKDKPVSLWWDIHSRCHLPWSYTHWSRLELEKRDFWRPEGSDNTAASFTISPCSTSSPPPTSIKGQEQLLNNKYNQQGSMYICIYPGVWVPSPTLPLSDFQWAKVHG